MPKIKAPTLIAYGGLLLALVAYGEPAEEVDLGTVRVRSEESSALKRHEIIKTEVVPRHVIEHKRAQTLADAVAGEVGVDAQNSCANCGSKRVTINGMRGEHTTVLIDGVPLHSAISSFYGMDAIPVIGIENIEVSRGSGASLVAPEAIGGVLNIITTRPTRTGIEVDTALGTASTHMASVLGSVVGSEGKVRLLLAGQTSRQGFWDVDANAVSEAPDLANESFFIKAMGEPFSTDQIEARYARQKVSILGGTVQGFRPTEPPTDLADPPPFQGGDVHRRYLGTDDLITDAVTLTRQEGMVRWKHFFPAGVQFQWTTGIAEQKQNSIYMHGYDYDNRDLLLFNEGRWVFSLGDSHFLTVGGELKNQDMASNSEKLYVGAGLPRDDFSYQSRALYLQDVWVLGENTELSTALRVDQMRVNWLSQTAREFEIDQTLVAPRVHLKLGHNPHWTSRLMYGRGYRPPLSFFESQHGLNEYGFIVRIEDIEKSHSLGYSLNYAVPGLSVTASSHHTWLSNQAYADWDVPDGDPAVFRNYPGELRVWANDIVVNWDVRPDWALQLVLENTTLPAEYKRLLPAAAVEQRVRLVSDFHWGDFEWINTFTWVGARDLTGYGYDRHYRTQAPSDDPLILGIPVIGERKNTFAPSFLTWDIYLGWNVRQSVTLFASVQNVLDFTQTGYGDSPLNWSTHTPDPTHFHLDNNHTWGPLRGRVFSFGLKAKI